MNRIVALCVGALIIVATGCATLTSESSDPIALEGKWVGAEISPERLPCEITFLKDGFDVNIGNGRETYKGTFVVDTAIIPATLTLSISESSIPSFANKTAYGICRVEGNKLSVAFCQPGLETRPVSFTVSLGVRAFEGHKQ